jgi:hypothetical protein
MAHSGGPTLIARVLRATPGEIMTLQLMRLQISSYQRDQRIAKAELDALDAQPEPGAAMNLFADRVLRG